MIALTPQASTATSGAPETVSHAEAGQPAFRLSRYKTENFLSDRRRLQSKLSPDREQTPRNLLNLAEFYLAHALMPEGLSVLSELGDDLPEHMARQRAQLELALGMLDTRTRDLSPHAKQLLSDKSLDWPDRSVFEVLNAYEQGDDDAAAERLNAASARIAAYPKALVERILPRFLDLAIRTSQWSTAKDLAARFEEDPELAKLPAYPYLLGRTAEKGGDLLMAFENFQKAGEGNDIWAHHARLSLIELGLDSKTLSREDALSMMKQASRSWSGDRNGIELLQRIVELEIELDDTVAALGTLGAIISRHPDTPAASLARQQARSLWTTFYAKGRNEELSLTEFLAGHYIISMDYRFEPGFGAETEALADRFMAAGSTVVAADEYRETHDYLLVGRDLGLLEVDDVKLDSLKLKQAEALYRGGQIEQTEHILSEGLLSDDTELADQLNMLKAKLFADQGDAEDVVRTSQTDPSLNYQRLRAAALFDQGDWEKAQAAYTKIVDQTSDNVDFVDVVRLLLVAHRSGDRGQVNELVQRYPDLNDRPQWEQIARGFSDDAPALLPLRSDTARARVDLVSETLDTLNDLKPGSD